MILAQDITKQYHGHEALRKFSAEFKSGEVTGLLGPNGAGKTTFIRTLNQIIKADSGEIEINGKPLSSKHIESIGYLPEERGLYKKMRVLKQIVYFGRLKGLTKAVATENAVKWLEKFELKEWANSRILELSKGMAQKVQFIITVIHDPDILILDEPFSGFDPINTNLIKKEIQNFKDEGKTVVLSTHNMQSVEEICDSVVLLNRGRKILDGPVQTVRETYRPHIYKVAFTGSIIGFTNALWTDFELVDRKQIGDNRFTVYIKMLNDNDVNSLLTTVIPHVKIESVEEVLPGMDEIFIKAISS